jgi:hypothetical protein
MSGLGGPMMYHYALVKLVCVGSDGVWSMVDWDGREVVWAMGY